MPCSKQKQVSKHLREASKKIEGKEQQLIMAAFAKVCEGGKKGLAIDCLVDRLI